MILALVASNDSNLHIMPVPPERTINYLELVKTSAGGEDILFV